MFTTQLHPNIFTTQREFVRVMDSPKDFYFAATVLVKEEIKELREAYVAPPSDENFMNIFKELADVVYTVAYFFNVLPPFAVELLSQEQNEEVDGIIDEAAKLVTEVTNSLRIPMFLIALAFEEVHKSNMTKVNPETGVPERREDGKVMKGEFYKAPDMNGVVQTWKEFVKKTETRVTN